MENTIDKIRNFKPHPNQKYGKEIRLKIINMYNGGLSSLKIGKITGINPNQVAQMLRKAGIKMRTYQQAGHIIRKYNSNENYFENIDTEKKAYWLGFITADGCLDSHRKFSMMLSAKDSDHLLKFRSDIEADNPIEKRKKYTFGKIREYCRIRIFSPTFVKHLISKGLCENKSLIIKPYVNISENLVRHYIRGLFDGNGSIGKLSKGGYFIDLCGTKHICQFFKNFIVKNKIKTNASIIKSKNKNLHYISFQGGLIVPQISELIYKNSGIFLDRKMNLAKQIKGIL